MVNIKELDNAIGTHGMWKTRLKAVISTGKVDTPVETIRQDNQCDFGKWLYGLGSADRLSAHYTTVKELHAEFHKTAARVAELASSGKKAEAEKMMAPSGDYTAISAKLTRAMMDWKNGST